MKSFIATVSVLLASAGLVLSNPVPTTTLEKRADICGQWDSITTGTYTLYQDLWDEAAATSGSQCSGVDSLSGSTLAWHTKWTWVGASSSVKSYANVVVTQTAKALKSYTSLKSVWKYTYTGTSIVADVAYDMFLGTSTSTSSGSQYEIMVWLAALGGAGPISSTGSPIATPTIAGHTWNLYSGPNGAMTVFSFVAQSEITSFSGDLLAFFTYLETYQGVSSSLYLQSIGAGTEPFTGTNAVFTTSAYSVVVV